MAVIIKASSIRRERFVAEYCSDGDISGITREMGPPEAQKVRARSIRLMDERNWAWSDAAASHRRGGRSGRRRLHRRGRLNPAHTHHT
jgi:hypothetical protein